MVGEWVMVDLFEPFVDVVAECCLLPFVVISLVAGLIGYLRGECCV